MVGFFTGATEGYLLDGIESVANTSINRIVADIYSTDGQCGRTGTSDTNTYLFERYFVAGTATYSVSWGAGSVPFEGTRNDQHMMFIANKAAHADTGTSPAYNIRIWTLDRLDATPFPVIGAGASVYWMNESTPIYDGTVTTNTSIVPTSGSGTFTSVSSSLKYWKTLNYLNFELAVTITTNGSAAGSIVVAMPVACLTGAQGSGAGLDTATSIGCIWSIQGASSNLIITKYDGTYPGGTGKVIQVNGSYRTAP
jgi:hypothetical protein